MRVTRRLTASQIATQLCRFIPELEPGVVLFYLERSEGYFIEDLDFHKLVKFFDGLVIDGKESVPCA